MEVKGRQFSEKTGLNTNFLTAEFFFFSHFIIRDKTGLILKFFATPSCFDVSGKGKQPETELNIKSLYQGKVDIVK